MQGAMTIKGTQVVQRHFSSGPSRRKASDITVQLQTTCNVPHYRANGCTHLPLSDLTLSLITDASMRGESVNEVAHYESRLRSETCQYLCSTYLMNRLPAIQK